MTGSHEDKKEQKAMQRIAATPETATSVVAFFGQLLKERVITPEDFVAQALFWEKINPAIWKAFQPSIDALFPLRTSTASDRARMQTAEFLTFRDFLSFAQADKATYSIFKEGLSAAKQKEAERAQQIILGCVTQMQLMFGDINEKHKMAVARVYHEVFGNTKGEFKAGQVVVAHGETKDAKNAIEQVINRKLIEQAILLHAFALDKKRTNEKICSESEIKAVIDSEETVFSMDSGRLKLKLPLSDKSVEHLAQLFNAYYPLLQATAEYDMSQYFSERKPTAYVLSFNCNIFLEQVLPVIRCLATKPSLQGDLSKEPKALEEPLLGREAQLIMSSSLNEELYRC
ncbi:MAG: hypothetical protein ACYCQI_14150 [Gammaproteobacteria bacterium]